MSEKRAICVYERGGLDIKWIFPYIHGKANSQLPSIHSLLWHTCLPSAHRKKNWSTRERHKYVYIFFFLWALGRQGCHKRAVHMKRELYTWKETYIDRKRGEYWKDDESVAEFTLERTDKECQKRPVYLKRNMDLWIKTYWLSIESSQPEPHLRDIYIYRKTYIYEKTLTFMKKALSVYINRHTCMRRDV